MAIPLEDEIFYPESDGKPMAETEDHLEEMVYAWEALKHHFEDDPDVFVGADMFLYYREGDPRAVVAPDGFVVRGVPKLLPGNRRRRKYLLWDEGRVPCLVLETTSDSTRSQDRKKKATYETLGVEEYFQFDPLGEYLNPTLQGYRLVDGRYRPIRPNPDGSLISRSTGVLFQAEGPRLRLIDAASGAPLLRNEEEREGRLRAEEGWLRAEEGWRQSEEKAAAEARARKKAEEKAAAEAKARREAEEAQLQAEEKLRALERELQRLRNPR